MTLLDPGAGLEERVVVLPDGRRLRAVAAGSGEPTVVFEAGHSACASSWVAVQREVAATTSTLSYDRAGYGGSDPDPGPRTLDRLADDLVALVAAAVPSGRVALVGHSWGGAVVRAAAAAIPTAVAGVVLVDATVTDVLTPRAAQAGVVTSVVLSHLSRTGLHRPLLRRLMGDGSRLRMTDADRSVLERDFFSRAGLRVAAQEARGFGPSTTRLAALEAEGVRASLVHVLGERADHGQAGVRRAMREAAAREVARRPDARLVTTPDAGHLVPQEAPDVVVQAVKELVGRSS